MSTLRRRPTINSTEMTTNPALPSSTTRQDTDTESFFSSSGHHPHPTSFAFPTSTTSQNRCCPCNRLVCHKLIDTDDLILREERERLQHHSQSTAEALKHLDAWDAFAEHAVEGFICPLGLKQPTSCCHATDSSCAGCCQHPATIWTYRVYQLVLVLVFVYFNNYTKIAEYVCSGNQTDMFYCSKIQDYLAESNRTKAFASVDDYAGMRATMRALAESDYESSWFGEGTKMKFSIAFKENATSPGFTLKQENAYLWWYTQTHTPWPAVIYTLTDVSSALLCIAFIMVFSLKAQPDDPKEILFPALLESKGIAHPPFFDPKHFHFVRPRRMVWQLLFVAGICGVPWFVLVNAVLNFLKNFTPLASVAISVAVGPGITIMVLTPIIGLLVQMHNSTTLANILIQLCSLNVHPSDKGRLGREVAHATSVHHLMTPLMSTVQQSIRQFETEVVVPENGKDDEEEGQDADDNATSKEAGGTGTDSTANALIKVDTLDNSEEDEYDMLVQGSYERWMELYKTTVGALHIWSWRMTPVLGCLMFNICTSVFNAIVTSVFLFTGVETEPDIQGSRYARFQHVSPELLPRTLAAGMCMFVVLQCGISIDRYLM